jgi:predicted nucleic acid-binding protein
MKSSRLARRRGLKVIGTLGVLVQGADHGLVDINVAIERLQTTDFRCTPHLFE